MKNRSKKVMRRSMTGTLEDLKRIGDEQIVVLNRIAGAFERIATTIEDLERRVHGTKRKKRRAAKTKS